jgi:hypothetical protein
VHLSLSCNADESGFIGHHLSRWYGEKKSHNLFKFCPKLNNFFGKFVMTFEFDILNANKEEWNDME